MPNPSAPEEKRARKPSKSAPAKSSRAQKRKRIVVDNGKGGRRTPAQLARQERVFEQSVMHGKTMRQIAALEGVDYKTVQADLRAESARRSAELGENRENEVARALTFYGRIAEAALRKSEMYDGIAKAGGKVVDHSLDAALKARERIDKILGIDAAVKVDLGLDVLLEAIKPK